MEAAELLEPARSGSFSTLTNRSSTCVYSVPRNTTQSSGLRAVPQAREARQKEALATLWSEGWSTEATACTGRHTLLQLRECERLHEAQELRKPRAEGKGCPAKVRAREQFGQLGELAHKELIRIPREDRRAVAAGAEGGRRVRHER